MGRSRGSDIRLGREGGTGGTGVERNQRDRPVLRRGHLHPGLSPATHGDRRGREDRCHNGHGGLSGAHRDLIRVPAGGSRVPAGEATLAGGEHYFRMDGRGVRDFVSEHVPPAVRAFLKEAGVAEADVTHLAPHQANGHMIEDFAQDLGLTTAWVHTTVHEYGNTGAASIPITLDTAVRSGDVQ